jgi:hypothetical protein
MSLTKVGKVGKRILREEIKEKHKKEGFKLASPLHKVDPPGTLPKSCNAGFIDIEWITQEFTKGEVQQC